MRSELAVVSNKTVLLEFVCGVKSKRHAENFVDMSLKLNCHVLWTVLYKWRTNYLTA